VVIFPPFFILIKYRARLYGILETQSVGVGSCGHSVPRKKVSGSEVLLLAKQRVEVGNGINFD